MCRAGYTTSQVDSMIPLVRARSLRKYFPVKSGFFSSDEVVRAVDGVSFDIQESETVGLVGESGCGKTTLGMLTLRLYELDEGSVEFMGRNIFTMPGGELKKVRRQMQIIFQNPSASLNPRKTVGYTLSQPLLFHNLCGKDEVDKRVLDLLSIVGLKPPEEFTGRYPHELSGGQTQRVVIARALAVKPKFVVADEPVSGLDVSVRTLILSYMKKIQKKFGIAFLYITHDLAVVRSIADRIMVMYLGKIVETGNTQSFFENPLHPYSRALLSATPVPDPKGRNDRKRIILKGEAPSPIHPPSGCYFHTRCPYRKPKCTQEYPKFQEIGDGHRVTCHYPLFNREKQTS